MDMRIDGDELFKQMREEALSKDKHFYLELIVAEPEKSEDNTPIFAPLLHTEGKGDTNILFSAIRCLEHFIEETYKNEPELKFKKELTKLGIIQENTHSIDMNKGGGNE